MGGGCDGRARQDGKDDGITPAQQEAMLVGSMFGWDVPGADPDHYDKEGNPNMTL